MSANPPFLIAYAKKKSPSSMKRRESRGDRFYAKSDFFGLPFELIDTGGINARSKVAFNEQIRRQAEIAIEEADSLIMVVDSQVGPTDLDYELAQILLRTKKPLCLAVNKIDDRNKEHLIYIV